MAQVRSFSCCLGTMTVNDDVSRHRPSGSRRICLRQSYVALCLYLEPSNSELTQVRSVACEPGVSSQLGPFRIVFHRRVSSPRPSIMFNQKRGPKAPSLAP